MSGSYFDPDWAAKVTVPVKRVGERWEFFYGGEVPVKEGTLGELTVNADCITDERFRERVTQELTVRILDEETELLVALSDRETNRRLTGDWPDPRPLQLPPGTTRFARVRLGPIRQKAGERPANQPPEPGGLWLKLKGLERCELHGSTVRMPPDFDPPMALSLNHALTMLSRTYEKHRISNTGNVYKRVFYQDHDQHWYPLDDLRTGVQADGERQLLNRLWTQVEQEWGWRPASPVRERERRK